MMGQQNNPAENGTNELIDQLISNQNTDAPSVVQDNDGQVLITSARVVNIRYKIYVIILLLLIFFLGYEYLQPAYDDYVATNAQLDTINLEIENFSTRKLQQEADKKLITTINQQSNQIVSCLNYQI
ncbi:hypothetical protein KKG31_06570 [Patescibacteria group bacterium]|nr:hypothetical protein [Patescibacteria group bacterium]MBU1758754.1 hypothetical protein [Patescibacteria group bacterium]